MKIGLIDADLQWRPKAKGRRYGKSHADVYPNLALMKISAYHKAKGNDVEWYTAINGHYDYVYISKVFSDTPISQEYIDASIIICGGTGFQIHIEEGKEVFHEDVFFDNSKQIVQFSHLLPEEAEHIMPDYSLYPMIKDTAFGFLSRGCPRGCQFCHVAAKEGRKSYKVADLSEWWNGQKNITLMDPNILACKDWKKLLQQLIDSKAKVDINQGLDARLMTEEKARMLSKIKLSAIHFAWDDYKQKDKVIKGLKLFRQYFAGKLAHGNPPQVYVLCNFDTSLKQDLERIYTLKELDYDPYVMIYNKQNADPVYKSLQRWVNMRAIFRKIERFEDYNKKLAKE